MLILARLLPAYLEDLRKLVVAGRMAERSLVGYLEKLLTVVATPSAQADLAELGIEPRKFFAGLEAGELSRLQAFLSERLPRVLSKQG